MCFLVKCDESILDDLSSFIHCFLRVFAQSTCLLSWARFITLILQFRKGLSLIVVRKFDLEAASISKRATVGYEEMAF